MRRHGILLVCAETAVAFRDKCGLLLIDPGLALETQSTYAGSIFRHQLRRRTKGTECLQAAVLRHRSLVTRAKGPANSVFRRRTSSWDLHRELSSRAATSTTANSGHHFYPSSPPAAQRAKETPPPLVALSNCRALADAGWGSRNQGVALLHNTTCSKPQ